MSEWLTKVKTQIRSPHSNIAMDGLYQCCDYLWKEPSLDRMMRRCQRIMREIFDITLLAHYDISGRGTGIQLTRSSSQSSSTARFDRRLEEQIFDQLKLLNLGQEDYKSGINYLQIAKDQLAFIILGDSSNHWSLLIWQQPHSGESDPPSSDQLRSSEAWTQTLNFFVRQIQVMYRAYARYQKAQALLLRDDLTGLYNYRYLETSLENEIRRVHRFKTTFSVLFIDLDHFKPINDTHGHLAGSQVIKQVAEVLKDGLREVDSVFRYGGDEYVVMLLGANSETALRAAERIRQKIAETSFIVNDSTTVRLTASIGVASCPEHGQSKEELLRMADESMYRSKKSGKNRVLVVDSHISQKQLPLADL